jgi:hypothetical protein
MNKQQNFSGIKLKKLLDYNLLKAAMGIILWS